MSSDNKKPDGIILYKEKYELIANLNDEQRGKLLLALFEFAFDEQVNTELDAITNMVFIIIKQSIELDRKKYERISEMRKRMGQKGGAPKGNKNAQKYKNNQKQPQNNLTQKNNQNNLLVDFSETPTNKEFDNDFEKIKTTKTSKTSNNKQQTTNNKQKSLLANASKPKENQASLFLKFWNKHLKSKSKLNQRETQLLSEVLAKFTWQDIESAICYCAQKDSLNGSAAGSFKIAPIYFLEHAEALIAEAGSAHEKQAAEDARVQNALLEEQRRQQAAREQAAEEARHRAAVVPMPADFADKWGKKKPTTK